jgi:hypothetical protein
MSAFAFRTDYLLAVDFQADETTKEAASRLKLIHCSTRGVFSSGLVWLPIHPNCVNASKPTVYTGGCLQQSRLRQFGLCANPD